MRQINCDSWKMVNFLKNGNPILHSEIHVQTNNNNDNNNNLAGSVFLLIIIIIISKITEPAI